MQTQARITTTAGDTELARVAELAATYASQGLCVHDVVKRLEVETPNVSHFYLSGYAHAAVLEQNETEAEPEKKKKCKEKSDEPILPMGPYTGPADPRLQELKLGPHALLPNDQIGTLALIPTILARYVHLFAPSPRPQHTVELHKLNLRITVGHGREHKALTSKHMVFLTALFAEAQVCEMTYVSLSGKPHLKITTTLKRLHQLMRGDSRHGGSGHKTIKDWLDDLCDTPVVFTRLDGKNCGSDHRFITHWEMHGRKVVIYLSPFWSEAFADRTKKKIKPINFAELCKLSGSINKLAYMHIDYASSHNGKTELRTTTLLERTGALDSSRDTGDSLIASASRRLQRLDMLWMLDGLPLSNGRVLRLNIDKAQCEGNRAKLDYKLVVETDPDKDRTAAQAGIPILAVPFFQRSRERWLARRNKT